MMATETASLQWCRDRIVSTVATQTGGPTQAEAPTRHEQAARLLHDVLEAAGRHGVTAEDFTAVTSLGAACWDALSLARRRG